MNKDGEKDGYKWGQIDAKLASIEKTLAKIEEKLDTLNLQYQQARQNQITDELIDIISTNYPESEPIEMEGSIGQYTIDQLVNYIIQHESIKRNDVKLIAHKYDNPNSITKYGGYMRAKNKYHKYVYTASNQMEAYPSTFFKLDDFDQDLTNFRMHDNLGNDVSKYCVLLINKKLYAFVNNSWIQINYKGE